MRFIFKSLPCVGVGIGVPGYRGQPLYRKGSSRPLYIENPSWMDLSTDEFNHHRQPFFQIKTINFFGVERPILAQTIFRQITTIHSETISVAITGSWGDLAPTLSDENMYLGTILESKHV